MRRQLRSSLVRYLAQETTGDLARLTESELDRLFHNETTGDRKDREWVKDMEPPPEKK
jgi:hypothetical protein